MSLSHSLLVTPNARWAQEGITVAGSHGYENDFKRLNNPHGLVVDDDETMLIADTGNHRIVAWKKGDSKGHVVAGGHGRGSGPQDLNGPKDVLISKQMNSLIICDSGNSRVVQWPLNDGTRVVVLIGNICCHGLAIDRHGCVYVSDEQRHEVRRFTRDGKVSAVAGGNGKGFHFIQLNTPISIFVDEEQSVYVSDSGIIV
jgi:serine/threonine protein kinase, bacterial